MLATKQQLEKRLVEIGTELASLYKEAEQLRKGIKDIVKRISQSKDNKRILHIKNKIKSL